MKQAIVINQSLDMSRGKEISQACHASLEAAEAAEKKDRKKWRMNGAKKVILNSGSEKLEELKGKADSKDLPNFMVRDAGKTEVEEGSETAIGIGPGRENLIDEITGSLNTV